MSILHHKHSYKNILPKLYFYKDGNYCIDSLGGGWTYQAQEQSRIRNYATYTTLESISAGYNNYIIFYPKRMIDFSKLSKEGYTQLCVDYKTNRNTPSIFITPTISWGGSGRTFSLTNTTRNTFIINITKDDVPSYILIRNSYNSSINIHNIWME